MGPATEVLFGMISSAIDNWLSNFLEEKGKAIIGKVKLGIFRREITEDLQEYINSHDVFVLTNDAFEVFLSKYNVVESIISSALDSSIPDYKEKFIKKKIKQFCMSGTTNRQVSPEDEQQIYEFLEYLYERADAFFRDNLTNNDRYILHHILSSKNEVIDAIKENAAQILDSLSGEKENTGFRKIISSIKMCDAYNASLFHYLNKKMSKIYGRDEQLNRLCAFLDNDLNFSFCVISGPGGIGKSKLAHSFIQRQNRNQTGWKMFFVNEDTLDQMATCDDWNHDSNTLLVVDYAGIEPALLHRCFVNVANYEKKFEKKLRIILLDRIGMIRRPDQDTNETIVEYPNWFRAIVTPWNRDSFADPQYLMRFLYGPFIELEGLTEEEYISLIHDFAAAIKADALEKYGVIIPDISDQQILDIIDFSNRTSSPSNCSRPIFIMLATDAILNGGDLSTSNITEMMDVLYKRDREQWDKIIGDEKLFLSLEKALVYATIFGEWTGEDSLVIAGENVGNVIEEGMQNPRKQGKIEDWLKQMGDASTPIEDVKIVAYEPDIVGEYYVLKQFKTFLSTVREWHVIVFEDIKSCYPFLERTCQDFVNSSFRGDIYKFLDRLTKMLNENDIEKAECIIRLWDSFLSNVNDKTQKGRAENSIRSISKKYLFKSKVADEFYVKYYINEPTGHGNTWREKRFRLLENLYNLWPDSLPIVATYIEMLGAMASWYYRNGNLERGNNYSKKLNGVVSNCDMDNEEILIVYVSALGNIISGHYYMNDVSDTEAEIDDPFKLDTLVNKLYTEAHAVAYVDAIRTVITQQAKYADDARITRTVEQFCIHVYKQRWTRGYKRSKETSGLIEWKECQIFHSIFT